MKLAVLFPGIGYTVTKPLLYYAGRLAASAGYRVVPVAYGDLPGNAKGDPEKMRLCLVTAYERAEEALRGVDWHECNTVLFIVKSIGTIVAARSAISPAFVTTSSAALSMLLALPSACRAAPSTARSVRRSKENAFLTLVKTA